MALDRDYLESLGLEIAKKKYYNAAKVEGVIETLRQRASALESENAALRERAETLSHDREEIGDAILSARTIARQIIAEAQEKADGLLAEAQEKADALLAGAREKADALLSEAKEKASGLASEAEERCRAQRESCEEREQRTIRSAQELYLQLREQCLDAAKQLDGEWQRFLCSFGEPETVSAEDALPDDLDEKLGQLAEYLSEIEEDGEAEQ